MTRLVRAAAGGVVVFVLVLVAAVSGLVALVGSAQLREETWWSGTGVAVGGEVFADPVTAQAEVLDVDASGTDGGWASADVAVESGPGEVEVTYLDLGERTDDSPPLPEVGDVIEVVHQAGSYDYVVRVDDPVLTGQPDQGSGEDDVQEQRAAAQELVRRSGVLAVSSLVLALVVAAATVVVVRRAPAETHAWAG